MTTYSSKTLLETEKWVRLKKERYKRIQSKSISGSYFTFILYGGFLDAITSHFHVTNFYFLIYFNDNRNVIFKINNRFPHRKGIWPQYILTDGACWNSVLSVQNIRDLCGNNDFKIKCKKGTTPSIRRVTSAKSKGTITPSTIVKPRWVREWETHLQLIVALRSETLHNAYMTYNLLNPTYNKYNDSKLIVDHVTSCRQNLPK